MSLRDQILAAEDLQREAVDVPEWGGLSVYVRTLTGAERDAYESDIIGTDGKVKRDNIRAKLLVRTVVDETGERVFTDADVDALSKKSGSALVRLFDKAQRLNALTKGDVAELEKNSAAGAGGDSSTSA